ncbi:beta-1,3-galactosyl-O-glycosyl-glycoprotein beta-1,6-N-acetylglucosaminyltransferase 4 isoform X3 [Prinia subflava]
MLKSRGFTPRLTPSGPGSAAARPSARLGSRDSRAQDKEPGPGLVPAPALSYRQVEPAVAFGKLFGRSAPEGQPWGSGCRVRRRGGVEAAGSSRSQVPAGTSPSPPTRPPPPARQVSGRAAALLFFLHVTEENAVPHAHRTPRAHTSAPRSRAGRQPGTAAIRPGECAFGGRVPGQRGALARRAKPELGGEWQQLPSSSREARSWAGGGGKGGSVSAGAQRGGAARGRERRAGRGAGGGRSRRTRVGNDAAGELR